MKKVLLLISPKSRRGAESITLASEHLQTLGYSIINDPNQESTDPNGLIIKYAKEISYVIVGGGDGSVNKVLPSLVKAQVPLVVIPLGTANNLARHYNLSYDIAEALRVIEFGVNMKIDLGLVNNIYFVNVVGLGLSTYVNTRVPATLKKYLGAFAFVLTAFYLSTKIRPFRLNILADGKSYTRRSWQISVCNGRHYGNGLTVKHDASLLDGKLHALSTEVAKWWQGFFLIPALISGRYKKDHDVSLFEAETIELTTRRILKIDVDGDIQTRTPATFKVHRSALLLRIPESEGSNL
ncbi:lipid kinase [Bacteriovorax sp. PP10]|uniref:Lipid kinase n=1 Tax=Bacteriovorax antarcticus TaxID=3088717 RepID=A0ABU5VYJ2_9BACT|nr:lipid kinase [Bacteriovorax sp. PP10]MEA9357662.1 lipid kinase [Bacteriovorax sp. PP10]